MNDLIIYLFIFYCFFVQCHAGLQIQLLLTYRPCGCTPALNSINNSLNKSTLPIETTDLRLTFGAERLPAAGGCSGGSRRLVLLRDVEPLEDVGQRHLQQLDLVLLHLHPLLQVGQAVGHVQAAGRRAAVVWGRKENRKKEAQWVEGGDARTGGGLSS